MLKTTFCPSFKKPIFGALNFKRLMIVRAVVLFILVGLTIPSMGQDVVEVSPDTPKKSWKPDIPGSIMVEFGWNFKNGVVPSDFQKSWWGSRTLNIYYHYPFRILKSRISFNPGIGFSLERFKFTNNYTLPFEADPDDGTYPLIPAADIYPGTIQRSFIVNNYIEAPLEFRYDSKPDDIARSFNVSLGWRVGILYDAFTKVDYTHNGEDKSMKDKQWHGMNRWRQGVYLRAGYGGFGASFYYNYTPLFEAGKGPEMTKMNTVTVTLFVNGF